MQSARCGKRIPVVDYFGGSQPWAPSCFCFFSQEKPYAEPKGDIIRLMTVSRNNKMSFINKYMPYIQYTPLSNAQYTKFYSWRTVCSYVIVKCSTYC